VRRKLISLPEFLPGDAVLSMPEIGIETPLSELYDRVDFPPETA